MHAEEEEQAELEQLLLKSEGVTMEIERKVSDLRLATMAQMAGLGLGERVLRAKVDSLADELMLTKSVKEDDKPWLESKIAVLEEGVQNSKEREETSNKLNQVSILRIQRLQELVDSKEVTFSSDATAGEIFIL